MAYIEKIIAFDSPYSLYFNELACSVEVLLGNELSKVCLTPNYAYKIYLPGFDFLYSEMLKCFDIDEFYYERVKSLKSLGNLSGEISGEDLKVAARFYCAIENYFEKNQNCVAFVYNDLRWHHAIAIDVMNRFNINYFVFERGVFRPLTTSMDSRGVNANSSIKTKSFVSYSRKKAIDFSSERSDEKFINIKFFLFKICEIALSRFGGYKEINHTKKKRMIDYFFLYFGQRFSFFKKFGRKKYERTLSGNFLFVPLQLSSDTQTVLNSSFSSSQEFISALEEAFYSTSLYPEYKIVFKKHPMSSDGATFDERSICSYGSAKNLIDRSSGVITINSTVGFEALSRGKKVMTLGESFYTRGDLVFKCGPFSLKENLEKFVNEYNFPENVDAFLRMVEHDYQVPGSVYKYSKEDLDFVAKKIVTESLCHAK